MKAQLGIIIAPYCYDNTEPNDKEDNYYVDEAIEKNELVGLIS